MPNFTSLLIIINGIRNGGFGLEPNNRSNCMPNWLRKSSEWAEIMSIYSSAVFIMINYVCKYKNLFAKKQEKERKLA